MHTRVERSTGTPAGSAVSTLLASRWTHASHMCMPDIMLKACACGRHPQRWVLPQGGVPPVVPHDAQLSLHLQQPHAVSLHPHRVTPHPKSTRVQPPAAPPASSLLARTLRHTCVCCAPGHWIAAFTSASQTPHGSLLGTAPAHSSAPCLFAGSPSHPPPRRACQVRRELYGVRWAAQRRHLRSMEPGQRVHAVRGLSIPCVSITARQWHYFFSSLTISLNARPFVANPRPTRAL
jgi:hypothetical protein